MKALPLALLSLLAVAGGAAAHAASAPIASAPATLYFHPIDFYGFPINTQVPDPSFTEQMGFGLGTNTLSCVPDSSSGGGPFQTFHTWYGFSSPGYVEYGRAMDGHPRYWSERQMGYAGSLAGATPVLHWFLETDAVLANVVVDAEARASENEQDFQDMAGPLLFHGQSQPALLARGASQGVEYTVAGERNVYGFTIPLTVDRADLGDKGYALRIDARLDAPGCGDPDHAVMPSAVVPYADADHRPRLELEAADPVRVLSLSPRFDPDNGTVVVTGRAQSLWGNYDLDEGNVTLSLEGPEGRFDLVPDAMVFLPHAHGHHADPLEATWVVPKNDLDSGVYWLNWTVSNDQHTANATAHAAFRLGPDAAFDAPTGGGVPDASLPPQAMPAGTFLVPMALAAALPAARRRTTNNR